MTDSEIAELREWVDRRFGSHENDYESIQAEFHHLLDEIERLRGDSGKPKGLYGKPLMVCTCEPSEGRTKYLDTLGRPYAPHYRICPFCGNGCPEDIPEKYGGLVPEDV